MLFQFQLTVHIFAEDFMHKITIQIILLVHTEYIKIFTENDVKIAEGICFDI